MQECALTVVREREEERERVAVPVLVSIRLTKLDFGEGGLQ